MKNLNSTRADVLFHHSHIKSHATSHLNFDVLPVVADNPKCGLHLRCFYRDLTAYAEILKREGRQPTADPTTLVTPMLARFMATDRAFRKLGPGIQQKGSTSAAEKSE